MIPVVQKRTVVQFTCDASVDADQLRQSLSHVGAGLRLFRPSSLRFLACSCWSSGRNCGRVARPEARRAWLSCRRWLDTVVLLIDHAHRRALGGAGGTRAHGNGRRAIENHHALHSVRTSLRSERATRRAQEVDQVDRLLGRFAEHRSAVVAPQGQPYISPGQRQSESCELCRRPGCRFRSFPSPERAEQRASRCVSCLFRPFRACVFLAMFTQGGASRLRRFALPWADILPPLSGRRNIAFWTRENRFTQDTPTQPKWRNPMRQCHANCVSRRVAREPTAMGVVQSKTTTPFTLLVPRFVQSVPPAECRSCFTPSNPLGAFRA